MEIGKPQRIYRVEPLREPVPQKTAPPAPSPRRAPVEPQKAPAK